MHLAEKLFSPAPARKKIHALKTKTEMTPLEVENGPLLRRRNNGSEVAHDVAGILMHTALLAIFETIFFWR